MDVEIKDPDVWVSQIQGPLSMKLLENIAEGFSENDWKYFDWRELQILDQKVIISRSGFTNELGWEIYFRPENETEKIGDYILEEGKKLGMILVATPGFRCRRIEAGLLSAGQDFSKKTDPFSVGLGRFINFDKEDFIGKEALMKSDKKCKTWGIRVAEGTAIKGEGIKINEKNIGKITSSTWSPYQICGVGIVHLDNNENGPGDVVDVKCTDGKVHKGEICKLPMYDAKGEIVRGLNRNIPKVPNPWAGIKTTN
jgi:aminomethyltransferase